MNDILGGLAAIVLVAAGQAPHAEIDMLFTGAAISDPKTGEVSGFLTGFSTRTWRVLATASPGENSDGKTGCGLLFQEPKAGAWTSVHVYSDADCDNRFDKSSPGAPPLPLGMATMTAGIVSHLFDIAPGGTAVELETSLVRRLAAYQDIFDSDERGIAVRTILGDRSIHVYFSLIRPGECGIAVTSNRPLTLDRDVFDFPDDTTAITATDDCAGKVRTLIFSNDRDEKRLYAIDELRRDHQSAQDPDNALMLREIDRFYQWQVIPHLGAFHGYKLMWDTAH